MASCRNPFAAPTLRNAALAALAALLSGSAPAAGQAPAATPTPREIAVTIDDLPLGGAERPIARMQAATEAILVALSRNRIPAVAFVNESKLYRPGEVDARIALLSRWRDSGVELGNHTFSHPSLQKTPLPAFEEDVIRGETVTRMLLKEKGAPLRWFRHPFLQTGPTLEAKREFEEFLAARGYRVAPVTVDTNDWMYDAVRADAVARGDEELARRVSRAYVDGFPAVLDFFEDLSLRVFARPIRHVLLVHASELNAGTIDLWAAALRSRGYSFVPLDRALEDPAYASKDLFVSENGISWLHRWLFTRTGATRLKEEPDPPPFVVEGYRAIRKRSAAPPYQE